MTKQNTTKKEDFTPTSKMREYLYTATEILDFSPSAVTANCNIARGTWYQWLMVEGFEDWFYLEYEKARRRLLPMLDSIAFKYAEQGDFKYFELLYNKVEKELPERSRNEIIVTIVPARLEEKIDTEGNVERESKRVDKERNKF